MFSSPIAVHAREGKPVTRDPLRQPSRGLLEVARMARERNPMMAEFLNDNLDTFWRHQMMQLNNLAVLKHHSFPLTKIKKAMKADDEVKMISADAPQLVEKAIEVFILELTLRSWCHAMGNNRKTLERSDVACAVSLTGEFHFLGRQVPWDKVKRQMLAEMAHEDWLHI